MCTTSTKVKETSSLIPSRVTTEAGQSCLFMKKLTTAAISNIAYSRDLCPDENCFQTVQFQNMKLRMFKEDSVNERIQFFCVSLKSAFEALEKEYLHKLVVCFYDTDDNKAENLMESYIFEYTYTSENRQVIFCTETKGQNESKQTRCDVTNVTEQAKTLMQFILVMTQSYPRLPPSTYITIRTYYNDNAPENYQAPNFTKESTDIDYIAKCVNMTPNFLVVKTPFHRMASYCFVNDAYCNKDTVMASQIPVPSENPQGANSLGSDASLGYTGNTSKGKINCVCDIDINEELWKPAIIICRYCGKASHAACYGVHRQATKPDRFAHCCVTCANRYGCVLTDAMLLTSSPNHTKSLCLIRQALDYCHDASEKGYLITAQLMSTLRLSKTTTYSLTSQLVDSCVLVPRRKISLSTICDINSEGLKNNMEKYFIPFKNLPFEYMESTSQPQVRERSTSIEELMDDTDKLNQQDVSNICRVVERTASDHGGVPTEGIMKLYLDVLSSQETQDDELPLSGFHNPIDGLTNKKNTHDCGTPPEAEEQDREVEEYGRKASKRNAPNILSTPAKMLKGCNSKKNPK